MGQTAMFKVMANSSPQDWNLIIEEQRKFGAALAEWILQHLMLLNEDYGGFPVDRLQHCMQTAELAAEDGCDDEYVEYRLATGCRVSELI